MRYILFLSLLLTVASCRNVDSLNHSQIQTCKLISYVFGGGNLTARPRKLLVLSKDDTYSKSKAALIGQYKSTEYLTVEVDAEYPLLELAKITSQFTTHELIEFRAPTGSVFIGAPAYGLRMLPVENNEIITIEQTNATYEVHKKIFKIVRGFKETNIVNTKINHSSLRDALDEAFQDADSRACRVRRLIFKFPQNAEFKDFTNLINNIVLLCIDHHLHTCRGAWLGVENGVPVFKLEHFQILVGGKLGHNNLGFSQEYFSN